MDVALHTVVPGYTIEPAMMFAHSTCLVDVYTSQVEQICLPQLKIAQVPVDIRVSQKTTWLSRTTSWKWQLLGTWSELTQKPALDCSEHFIYDARYDTDKNFAHVLDNVCTPVLLAQKLLSEHLNRPIRIHVILREKASKMARETYQSLGIPTICTNNKVYGNLVEVSPCIGLEALQPELLNIAIANYNPSTPERVFIARRGNRSLTNHAEVKQFLEQRGFVTYYFEDLTSSEKWSLARNAKVAVAVHGAGTGNFVFNRQGLAPSASKGSGLRLIELYSPCFVIPTYRRFSPLLNGKWCAVRGQITPDIVRYLDFDKVPRITEKSPIRDPFAIDLTALAMALEYMGVEPVEFKGEAKGSRRRQLVENSIQSAGFSL